LKRAVVSVINDLVTDQRVHKSCLTLIKAGFAVTLVGRQTRKSPGMPNRPYTFFRMRLMFEKGPLFYAEYTTRLFFLLLFTKCSLLVSNDLDTLLPNFLMSRLKRIPLVYDSHEYYTETPELINRPGVQRIWKTIESYIIPRLRWMITVNESIAQLFEKKYGIKVYVVRNIPARRKAKSGYSKEQLGLPYDRKLLVLQGSGINIQRGAEELTEAMQFLPDAFLMIIGGGDVLPQLKQYVEENKLQNRILFLPRMPYEQMMSYTELADLGLTLDKDTNLNYKYSLPNKLFDYIQAGVPVMATPLPEISKIIKEYNIGTFTQDSGAETLAEEIRSAVNNTELMGVWQKNLINAAQELCWEKEETGLLKIYEELY
jgi:glycosyltransferase involved in cell wall biosynthesis